MSIHTDRDGDPIDVASVIDTETGERFIRIEAEAPVFLFTPERARWIAADLIKAADATDAVAQETTSPDGECHNHECGLVSSKLLHVGH